MPKINLCLAFLLALAARPAASADFAPISDAERALEQVAWQPEATAVVLFKRARMKMLDYPREVSSFLDVQVRLKILREEGAEHGEVAIGHSNFLRLKSLEARTVLPDGTVVPVPEGSIFVQQASRAENTFVTKVVFPSVQVGAILDYHYVVRWDSFYYLEPWFFDNHLPTLLSEITYDKPDNLGLEPWGNETSKRKIQFDDQKSTRGLSLRVWMEDLPSLPREPWAFPDADLSSRFMLVPKTVVVNSTPVPLLDSWKSVCGTFETEIYGQARRRSRAAKKQAKDLVASTKDPRQRAEILYRFVRDEILSEPTGWINLGNNSSVDGVLKKRRGLITEKALLLQVMLDAAGLDAQLLWAADRTDGEIDTSVANPWWFDRTLVTLILGDQRIFLDPSDRQLAFGRLAPFFEGTEALIVDRRKPQLVALPQTPYTASQRQAQIKLVLDPEGRLSGSGELQLSGHHAWRRLAWQDDPEGTTEAWQEWLEAIFEDFEISELKVAESVATTTVGLTWGLLQHEETVLGNEATIEPSRPFGPLTQIFDQPPGQRATPLLLAFTDRDQVSLQVTWPEGWEIDLLPETTTLDHRDGALSYEVQVDEGQRRVEYKRRFDLSSVAVIGRQRYGALREQFSTAARHDAQSLVLVRQ